MNRKYFLSLIFVMLQVLTFFAPWSVCAGNLTFPEEACLSVFVKNSYQKVLKAVKVPKVFETEKQLKSLGFSREMRSGVDEVYRLRQIVQALKSPDVDLKKTHIEDFANQIEEHIQFFLESIHKMTGEKKPALLRNFDRLADIARKRHSHSQVTYEWWLKWNISLLSLMDKDRYTVEVIEAKYISRPRAHFFSKWIYKDWISTIFSKEIVFLPTIKNLGVMALNRAYPFFAPLQMVHQYVPADGLIYSPLPFFEHDYYHGMTQANFIWDQHAHQIRKQFTKRWEEGITTWPREKREKMELIYFDFVHENDFLSDADRVNLYYGNRKELKNLFNDLELSSYRFQLIPFLKEKHLSRSLKKEYRKVKTQYSNNIKHLMELKSRLSDNEEYDGIFEERLFIVAEFDTAILGKWLNKEVKDFISFVSQINFDQGTK